jgi:hypothetical protein
MNFMGAFTMTKIRFCFLTLAWWEGIWRRIFSHWGSHMLPRRGGQLLFNRCVVGVLFGKMGVFWCRGIFEHRRALKNPGDARKSCMVLLT